MGLFDGLIGNASEVNIQEVQRIMRIYWRHQKV